MEVDVGEQGRYYSPNNSAKTVIEFLITIPRERLRPHYGDGFGGAPLATLLPDESMNRRNRGASHETSGTQAETEAAGEADV